MNWNEIILAIISALSGGGLGSFLTFRLSKRQQDQSDFKSLIEEYKGLVKDYKAELDELRKDVDILKVELNTKEIEVRQLRNQLMIFESSHADIPVPIWLKDTNGTMLFLNKEYERNLLHPVGKNMDDYIGHTDSEVWGDEVGQQFRDHDLKVMRKKQSIEFEETWQGPNGKIYTGKVIKYPRFLGNTVIGIGGILIEYKYLDKNNGIEKKF